MLLVKRASACQVTFVNTDKAEARFTVALKGEFLTPIIRPINQKFHTDKPVIFSLAPKLSIEFNMEKLGTKKRPIIVRVHSEEKARYVAETCAKHGWHYIIGFETNKPEDISDLEKMLNPSMPIVSKKVGRNDLCPCGSGKKYKKCCG